MEMEIVERHHFWMEMGIVMAMVLFDRAHKEACSGLSFNHKVPHLLATASPDETVKLWNLQDLKPSLLVTKSLKIGHVFALEFSHDDPFLLSSGGSEGTIAITITITITIAFIFTFGFTITITITITIATTFTITITHALCVSVEILALWNIAEDEEIESHFSQYLESNHAEA